MAIKKFNLLGRSTGKQPTNYPLLVFGRVKKKTSKKRWADKTRETETGGSSDDSTERDAIFQDKSK